MNRTALISAAPSSTPAIWSQRLAFVCLCCIAGCDSSTLPPPQPTSTSQQLAAPEPSAEPAEDSTAEPAAAEPVPEVDAPAEPLTELPEGSSPDSVDTEGAPPSLETAPEKASEKASEVSEEVPTTARTSTIVPPSRAYLPPNRNTSPPPPLPAPKSEKELAEEKKTREAAKKRGEITFDALVFDMEKDSEFQNEMLGPDNWDLHDKTWKIRGFILPTTLFSQTGITEFVLVRDNQECCFGPGAALYDCIIVTMEPGKSISYTTRVVTVKGKLEIDTESFRYPDDEEGHYAIYKMTAEEVK